MDAIYRSSDEISSLPSINSIKNFSLLYINCRSLNKNISEIESLIHRLQITLPVIAVSETWTSDDTQNSFNIPGYNFVAKSRCHKSGGGVGLYVLDSISFRVRDDLDFDSNGLFDSIFIELLHDATLVGCIYKPPDSDVSNFTSVLDTLLSKINKQKCILAGDFNINLLNHDTHKPTSDFINCIFSHFFAPTVNKPTRITPNTSTLIDNIFINFGSSHSLTPSIIYCDISDHLPILLQTATIARSAPVKHVDKRIFSSTNKARFAESLQNADWAACISDIGNQNALSADISYQNFITKFSSIFEDSFPMRRFRLNRKRAPRKPWVTPGLAKSCSTKEKLYKKFTKNPSLENKLKYIAFRNKLNTLLRKSEQSYYYNKFEYYKSDIKSTWRIIKNLLNTRDQSPLNDVFTVNGSKTDDKTTIAHKFNEYFANVGSSLAAKIPKSDINHRSFLKGDFKNSFVLHETDANEIISVVKSLKPNKSVGYDNIPLDTVLLSLPYIADCLSTIINKSFYQGTVPDLLKIAKVCPIHKKGDKSDVSNYRPISILPCFSKIYEKLVHNRLVNYFDKYSVLSNNQYGFRTNYSTYMAVINMTDKISEAMDRSYYSIGVFVDLSKAFDTLDHGILLAKLAHYGIRGTEQKWFKSYLENRTQYVTFNGTESSRLPLKCGVPQGSILGPILFILYINDIIHVSNILNLILFADDTNIFMTHKNLKSLINLVNQELIRLNCWFIANKLSLNINKTNFIIFTNKKYNKDEIKNAISFDGKFINPVASTKFLGVHIDERLSWSTHIHEVSNKISKSCGILSKLKWRLPSQILLTIYNSLILPYLQYCAMIWASKSLNKLNSITVLQKRAVRLICKANRISHAAPLFKKLKLLTISDIYKAQVAQFMYKFTHRLLPQNFCDYFIINRNIHSHYTRQQQNYFIYRCNTSLRLESIKHAGPRTWNALPIDIKTTQSFCQFKNKLKHHLLQYYL